MSVFDNKTILVTGATGLLGCGIVNRLLSIPGVKVITMGRTEAKLKDTFDASDNIRFISHDVSNPLPKSLGVIDFIFHAASPISGEVIKRNPLDVINANLKGTINCLEYLRAQGNGKMVVFSSATIYNTSTSTNKIAVENQTNYTDSIDAQNAPYSESKRMIEVIANAYHKQYEVDILIARFSYLYGYSRHPAKTAFYDFVFKALNGENIELNKSNLPRRDNIYIDDAIDGLLHLCEVEANGETYNISSCGDKGNYAAIDEIAESIVRVANKLNGTNVKVVYKTVEGERVEGLRLSNDKIKKTNWSVKNSLDIGIEKTLLQYRKSYEISK